MVHGIYYQFAVLQFGLTLAPWVFTKVMVVVAAHLRRSGLLQLLSDHLKATASLLFDLGFSINLPVSPGAFSAPPIHRGSVGHNVFTDFPSSPEDQGHSGFDSDIFGGAFKFPSSWFFS